MINVATKNLNKMNLFSGNKFLTIQWNILLPAKVAEIGYLYIGVSGESYIKVEVYSIKTFSRIIKPNRKNIEAREGFEPAREDKGRVVEGKGRVMEEIVAVVDDKVRVVDNKVGVRDDKNRLMDDNIGVRDDKKVMVVGIFAWNVLLISANESNVSLN